MNIIMVNVLENAEACLGGVQASQPARPLLSQLQPSPDTQARLVVWCLIFPYTAEQSVLSFSRVNSASTTGCGRKTGPNTLRVKQCPHNNRAPLPRASTGAPSFSPPPPTTCPYLFGPMWRNEIPSSTDRSLSDSP